MATDIHGLPRPPTLLPFAKWIGASKWRKVLVIYAVSMTLTAIVLAAWIAVAYMRGSSERDAGAIALNIVLSGFVSTFGLSYMHRGIFLRLRNAEQTVPGGSLPSIDWPWQLRLRHVAVYLVGIASLLFIFIPFDHQRAIGGFLAEYSAGASSTGSLAAVVFALVPLAPFSLAIVALTNRQMQRRDSGLLDARGEAVLAAEINWLFSFAGAFVTAMLMSWLAGSWVLAFM